MGKQIKVRDAIRALKKAGFIESPNHGNGTSHRRYIHKDDPKRFADIRYHSGGEVIPKGTLNRTLIRGYILTSAFPQSRYLKEY